ncbi:DNA primase [Paenibacillus oralis]|uniref:DNA primase n=1 Tax=Paenibacillus oralis TaxID=2490856 RepID=A0A3P3TAM1_9BACL|nr:CHC2 zinc finger domain-containing protein [Paenibacillus oralis]RRJ54990.1 DNA primase [Paenibacillus oralis]
MAKFVSKDTVTQVKNVSVHDLAVAMGHKIKSSGNSWQIYCPNPNHGYEKTPDTYISKSRGHFKCFGGGGCGCQGGDAITYYSWSTFGEWDKDNKEHFIDCVTGVAEIMGIPVVYTDGSVSNNERRSIIRNTPPRPVIEDVEPQPDEVCDRVYRRFLSLCPMYEEHVQEWRTKRQYSDEEIVAIGLRSIPREYSEVNSIIQTLLAEGYSLERVPGFTKKLRRNGNPMNDRDWYWSIYPSGKYFIPVRNELGQIVRMRVSTGRPDSKYAWFSSPPNIEFESDPSKMRKGGASSGAPLNIVAPYQVLQAWEPGVEITSYFRADFVITTEGEHKSHISANKLKILHASIPGSGNYKGVVPTLKRWGTKKLAIAMDMDALLAPEKKGGKNQYVFNHLVDFAKQALDEEGIEVVIWCWDPKHGKGLDDLLLGGRTPIEIDLRTKERRPVSLALLLT